MHPWPCKRAQVRPQQAAASRHPCTVSPSCKSEAKSQDLRCFDAPAMAIVVSAIALAQTPAYVMHCQRINKMLFAAAHGERADDMLAPDQVCMLCTGRALTALYINKHVQQLVALCVAVASA